MNLDQFATAYAAARTLSADYAKRLSKYAIALQVHARACELRDTLAEKPVNAFLRSLDRSPYTIRSYRSDLLTLWQAAADDDLVDYPILRRIYLPALPELLVECYDLDEARELLTHAKSLKGCYPNGVARRDYWAAAIALAWDSGLRRGDCWAFRRELVRRDATFRLVQKKTGKLLKGRLHPSTIERLDKVKRKQPCEWLLNASFFGRHFARIVAGSGVGRGSFKWLRRASGSHVEQQQPGAGFKHLGQGSQQVFAKHYDCRLGEHALPLPPELG